MGAYLSKLWINLTSSWGLFAGPVLGGTASALLGSRIWVALRPAVVGDASQATAESLSLGTPLSVGFLAAVTYTAFLLAIRVNRLYDGFLKPAFNHICHLLERLWAGIVLVAQFFKKVILIILGRVEPGVDDVEPVRPYPPVPKLMMHMIQWPVSPDPTPYKFVDPGLMPIEDSKSSTGHL